MAVPGPPVESQKASLIGNGSCGVFSRRWKTGNWQTLRACIPWFMDGDFSLPAAEFNSLDREDPPASEEGARSGPELGYWNRPQPRTGPDPCT